MNSFIKRFSYKEFTIQRIFDAANRRIQDIPVQISWKYSNRSIQNRINLERFRNIHSGKRCFIIGNGPSLLKMDLSKIKNEYSFGTNRIYLNFDKMGFFPNYYVAINELVIEQFHQDISQLPMPKFINWNRHKLFEQEEKYLNYLKIKFSLKTDFGFNMLKPISGGGTVTFVAMQLAYYMGFDKVILIGVDHNFSRKGIPNTSEVRDVDIDQDHFHPDYFPKGIRWQLPDLKHSDLSYSLARKAFETDGRQILDATLGGKCNVFKKVKYSDLF